MNLTSLSSIRFREQSTQPNAQSDTLVVERRVNAREIETLGSYVVAAFAPQQLIFLQAIDSLARPIAAIGLEPGHADAGRYLDPL